MTVRAQVANLTTLIPNPGLSLALDTNVFLWLGYSRLTLDAGEIRRSRPYLAFIARALNKGAKIHCTALNLVEAIHSVQRIECRLAMGDGDLKRFRADPANRSQILREVEALWATASQQSSLVPATLGVSEFSNMMANQGESEMDAYDMAIVETVHAAGIPYIISNDRDLVTYDTPVIVATANRDALAAAAAQGKLVAV